MKQNCTVITGLIDIGRQQWNTYNRDWDTYLSYYSNILSLNSKMVIYTQKKTLEFVQQERIKIDPKLRNTHIEILEIEQLPKFYLKNKINNIMQSEEYKRGLQEPNAPEYSRSEYSIMILSKLDLINNAIEKNPFDTEYFMWVDGGMCHQLFKPEHKNAIFPKNKKLAEINDKIFLLCRSEPCGSDLNVHTFYKSHINRFGAGVIAGKRASFKQFQQLFDKNLNYAIEQNLIDSEQSIFTVCYLQQKDLFLLLRDTEWYALFYHFL